MLYQLSYASPIHPETAPETLQNRAGTLPLRTFYGTGTKVSIPPSAEQTGGQKQGTGRRDQGTEERRDLPETADAGPVDFLPAGDLQVTPSRAILPEGQLSQRGTEKRQHGRAQATLSPHLTHNRPATEGRLGSFFIENPLA